MLDKKPTILIVVNDLNLGGTERHLLQVLPALVARGFSMTVYTLFEKGLLADVMAAQGVKLITPPRMIRFKWFCYGGSFLKLTHYLWQKKPDIVHFFLPRAYLIGSIASLIARSPIRIMSRRVVYAAQYRRGWYFRLEKYFHQKLQCALACSEHIYQELGEEGLPENKRAIIYNGVDGDEYAHLPTKYDARKPLKIPQHSFVMSIVANLHCRKGHMDLLQALGTIKEMLPKEWLLMVVGRDDGEQQKLQLLSQQLGIAEKVKWLGQVKDVRPILAAADIGILCSHSEGFSNALLESMASGLPMVVTAVSGSVEAVCDGVNGLVVPVANPPQLGQAILRLANDHELRRRMGCASRERVERLFSLQKMISDYANFYRKLA
ncbi:MAG: hypothetical protein A3F41_04620 [Coxiella sp. RIFCSPHIGHO2_12_FULL_44_14]|nr:MAG: hypothetical protein A3F41_04620 [Coxiella sp. RIFCSPHIGHO2_12_FULL_44_14]